MGHTGHGARVQLEQDWAQTGKAWKGEGGPLDGDGYDDVGRRCLADRASYADGKGLHHFPEVTLAQVTVTVVGPVLEETPVACQDAVVTVVKILTVTCMRNARGNVQIR